MPNGQLTPEIYLRILQGRLSQLVALGKMDARSADSIGRRAVDLLNMGQQMGPGLPMWFEIHEDYVGYTEDITPKPTGPSPWEVTQWETEQERLRGKEAFGQAKWGAEYALRKKQLEWQMAQRDEARGPSLQEMGDIFERFRGEYLAGAGQADWIQRWFAARMPNPYEEQLAQLRAKKKRLRWEVSTAQAELTERQTGGRGIAFTPAREPKRYKKPEKVKAPPTPQWLPQFAPGQMAGQPITKEGIRTPSAQAWGQLPWSQQQMLGGYADWAGGRPMEDIMQHMTMMLPEEPRGARYKRWRPAHQRA